MDISLVIPLYNEAESLPELAAWIDRVMKENNYSYEIIFVDDGSRDKSWSIIAKLNAENHRIRGIKFRRNFGKSAALNEGFKEAKGDVIITMDADLQDSPDEIPALYKMISQDGYDLVSGWKKKRHDPISKTIPSKLFNRITRSISGIPLHDFNCGLKAYKSDVVKNVEVYGEMHRYIPVIAKWAGFARITEKEVQHFPRKYGTTKFGLERFIRGFLDLLTRLRAVTLAPGDCGQPPPRHPAQLLQLTFSAAHLGRHLMLKGNRCHRHQHPHKQQDAGNPRAPSCWM